jgi:hypothetical protein
VKVSRQAAVPVVPVPVRVQTPPSPNVPPENATFPLGVLELLEVSVTMAMHEVATPIPPDAGEHVRLVLVSSDVAAEPVACSVEDVPALAAYMLSPR